MSPPTSARRAYKAATQTETVRSPARPPHKTMKTSTTSGGQVTLKPAKDAAPTPEAYWQGGEGKHETLRPSRAKTEDPALLELWGA